MCKTLQTLAMTLAFIAFLCGCATPTDHNAIRLAVSQSNEEAMRLYQLAPFRSDDGKLWMSGHHWVWDARVTVDGHDYTSRVTFDRNAAAAEVHVQQH